MKKYLLATILFVIPIFCTLTTEAMVRTEGVLDLNKMADEINGNIHDFTLQKNELVKNIKSAQSAIMRLKADYKRAQSRKEKTFLIAKAYAETAKLWNYSEDVHLLKINTIESVLPKLKKLRKSARQGILGRIEKQMNDPEFRRGTKTLYSNLSTMALSLDNPGLKKEILDIMRNNARLYKRNEKGLTAYNSIIKLIDRLEEHFHSELAKSRQALMIIQKNKGKTATSIEAMKHALTLQPLQTAMLDINVDEISDVPEVDIDELLLNDSDLSGSGEDSIHHNDPDVDSSLKQYLDGPEFLK